MKHMSSRGSLAGTSSPGGVLKNNAKLKSQNASFLQNKMRSVCFASKPLKILALGIPGSPVARTQWFHCWGPGFNSWSES